MHELLGRVRLEAVVCKQSTHSQKAGVVHGECAHSPQTSEIEIVSKSGFPVVSFSSNLSKKLR